MILKDLIVIIIFIFILRTLYNFIAPRLEALRRIQMRFYIEMKIVATILMKPIISARLNCCSLTLHQISYIIHFMNGNCHLLSTDTHHLPLVICHSLKFIWFGLLHCLKVMPRFHHVNLYNCILLDLDLSTILSMAMSWYTLRFSLMKILDFIMDYPDIPRWKDIII